MPSNKYTLKINFEEIFKDAAILKQVYKIMTSSDTLTVGHTADQNGENASRQLEDASQTSVSEQSDDASLKLQ